MVSTYAIAALLLNPELQTKQLKQHVCKAISDPGRVSRGTGTLQVGMRTSTLGRNTGTNFIGTHAVSQTQGGRRKTNCPYFANPTVTPAPSHSVTRGRGP